MTFTTATAAPTLPKMFMYDTRRDGTGYVRLSDYAPDWLRDAVRDAHDGETPNDWRHTMAAAVYAEVASPDASISEVCDSFADDHADTVTVELLDWVAADLSRVDYVDEFISERGPTTLIHSLRGGQILALDRVVRVIAAAVEAGRG